MDFSNRVSIINRKNHQKYKSTFTIRRPLWEKLTFKVNRNKNEEFQQIHFTKRKNACELHDILLQFTSTYSLNCPLARLFQNVQISNLKQY